MQLAAVFHHENRRGPHPRRSYIRPVRIAGHTTDGTDELSGSFAPQCRLTLQFSTQANAKCESFIKTLKQEEIYTREYRDRAELEISIEHFLERYYNRRRLHSALNYQSPAQFEVHWRQSSTAWLCRSSRPHRCDEFLAEYSLASCFPAELASASSAGPCCNP
jgi:Integrase core domain